jgi:enoyl-CoA hydratase
VSNEPTVYVQFDEAVAVIELRRPDRRNALNLDTITLLHNHLDRLASRVRVVMITGEGSAFCAGADLGDVEGPTFRAALLAMLTTIESMPAVTLAAVNGPAIGAGTQLVLACDLVCAAPSARFGIPAAKLGLAIDGWTTQRLVERVGSGAARSMLLAAEMFDVDDAERIGLVQRRGDVAAARQWADELSLLAPLSLLAHRRLLADVLAVRRVSDDALAAVETAWASSDAVEGPRAFAEKRPARFTGQ